MASSRLLTYFLVFYVIVLVQIAVCHSNSNRIICLPEKLSPLFIFGDSLFDSGNNNYFNATTTLQANYEPYGQTFFEFPTGRFSDGRVIPDFVAEYADLPLLPPYLYPGKYIDHIIYGINFASAGAGALVETRQGTGYIVKFGSSHWHTGQGEKPSLHSHWMAMEPNGYGAPRTLLN